MLKILKAKKKLHKAKVFSAISHVAVHSKPVQKFTKSLKIQDNCKSHIMKVTFLMKDKSFKFTLIFDHIFPELVKVCAAFAFVNI